MHSIMRAYDVWFLPSTDQTEIIVYTSEPTANVNGWSYAVYIEHDWESYTSLSQYMHSDNAGYTKLSYGRSQRRI